MGNVKRLIFTIMACLACMLALCPLSGCATQQETASAGLVARPVIASAQDVQSLTSSASTQAAATVKQAAALATAEPPQLQAPAQAVVASAQATATKLQAANKAAVANVKLSYKLPKQIIGAEQTAAATSKKIKSGIFYTVGRFIVITVFLLLVLGGLILFASSGLATTLGADFPILATVIFKPLEYLGLLVGKLWGYVESALAWLYADVRSIFPGAPSKATAAAVTGPAPAATPAPPTSA